jgi:uncharacterized protein (UPF0305 family)
MPTLWQKSSAVPADRDHDVDPVHPPHDYLPGVARVIGEESLMPHPQPAQVLEQPDRFLERLAAARHRVADDEVRLVDRRQVVELERFFLEVRLREAFRHQPLFA